MMVTVLNKAHFPVTVGENTFIPMKEVRVYATESYHKELRCNKETLRVGRVDNDKYIERHGLEKPNVINFCYDYNKVNKNGEAYKFAIEALANPIIENLPKKDGYCGYTKEPTYGLNCRFFNSLRIKQRGKKPVGQYDVFFSHGIGDKNYWIGNCINDFKYAFVPGALWEKRMRATGYKGEIFICGYTKLDPILQGKYKKTKRKKPYIVWAPTHGYHNKYKGRSSYPECMELIKQIPNEYETKIAMHPTSKLNHRQKHTPTIQELVDADVVIADAGSTLYEAWILGKPVIFPDWICKKDVLGNFKNTPDNFEYRIYNEMMGYHAKDMKHLIQLIDQALEKGMGVGEKEFINEIYPENLRGKAGETAAKYLIEIVNSVNLNQ